jgi:homoserine/homoserine lactone efflux protein
MNVHLFLAFCLAATLLALLPGPVVTLVVANSLGQGTRNGLATVAGAGIGNALLIAAAAVGLIAFFALLSQVFTLVRWAGAGYLIWLGVKAWRAHDGKLQDSLALPPPRRLRIVFLQGFLVGSTNPKAIIFYIAFLPQFVDPRLAPGPQLLAMGCAMIVIAATTDSGYALMAGKVRAWLATPRRRRLQGRITGGLLIGTGCGLLLARRGG